MTEQELTRGVLAEHKKNAELCRTELAKMKKSHPSYKAVQRNLQICEQWIAFLENEVLKNS